MVSRLAATVIILAAGCWAQTPISPVAFKQDTPPTSREGSPAPLISPEMRGDIQMARKMFREAVESYSAADNDSAVIVNKIGIAYHQMLELELARKQYERALKLD